MKAIIPCGGAGTRLRPITHTSAKQLVPVANKPILFYALESIAAAGIVEVGMIVGDTAEEVRSAVGSGDRWGLDVTYLPQDRPRGLAHCVLIAGDFLGEDDFVMYLGDNLLGEGVTEFVERFSAERAAARILLARVPDPHRFGVAELDEDSRVVRLVEKPPDPPSDLALVGVYLFDRTIHEAVRAIRPSWRDELEITDAIQWLIDHDYPVRSQVVTGYWKDTGQLEALLEGNRLVLESTPPSVEGKVDDLSRLVGRVVVQPGAEIVRSTIRGPAIIGEGTRVIDSFIGPFTSIYYGCEIIRSEIEHSIVLEQSRIVDMARIEDSLIGKQVEVTRSRSRPQAHRLMLGDHSRVDLV
ncbi:MAG: glucose-1-phosphate thymidylyltransferase [Actinomycetota bacterium]|nr:glucose-1-phosphate thymidylyltransferase [Actinomycetota bacterium]